MMNAAPVPNLPGNSWSNILLLQDCAYKFLVCEDKPGMPRPAIDSWDTEYMQENRWDEESASFIPVEPESDPINVNFDKLSLEVQNAVLVKFGYM
ncbi:hypothetical protein BU58_29420 [Escherichia coli O26:H11 str. 2011C-3274]|nr:hypothetical protein BU58_29420 [Escherichia coli O26:H11 str. 2011C-3274]